MSLEYGFTFEQHECIQCHGCELACKTWRGLEPHIRWRQVRPVWTGFYPQAKNLSISLACMHCHDPRCVEACPEAAIAKRETDGIVLVDRERCTGCQACLGACPFEAPRFGQDGKMQKCDLCCGEVDLAVQAPPCVAFCPTGALAFGPMKVSEKTASEKQMKAALALHQA